MGLDSGCAVGGLRAWSQRGSRLPECREPGLVAVEAVGGSGARRAGHGDAGARLVAGAPGEELVAPGNETPRPQVMWASALLGWWGRVNTSRQRRPRPTRGSAAPGSSTRRSRPSRIERGGPTMEFE